MSTSSSHWGTFLASTGEDGRLRVRPHPADPDPSPLLDNIADAHHHPARVGRPAIRRGWLERGPGPDESRGDDGFVEVDWDVALDLVARELRRVRGEAVYGGSYGWASAGRFHHAQGQLHRFLNLVGGYTSSVNSYSLGASLVVLPHIFGPRGGHAAIREGTDWAVIAEHTDLLVAFGGVRTANSWVTPGGRTRHTLRDRLRAATARGMRVAVLRETSIASFAASRAPARPASAAPTPCSRSCSGWGAPLARGRQAGYLLDERAGGAATGTAVEPPDLKDQPHLQPADRRVGQPPLVAAAYRCRQCGAGRAGGGLGASLGEQVRPLGAVFHPLNRHASQVRQDDSTN
jgi:hypothetical protein